MTIFFTTYAYSQVFVFPVFDPTDFVVQFGNNSVEPHGLFFFVRHIFEKWGKKFTWKKYRII